MSGLGGTLRPAGRAQDRRDLYKKTLDPDESRRKREELAMQLRKDKKENLEKKRREALLPELAGQLQAGGAMSAPVRVRARCGERGKHGTLCAR